MPALTATLSPVRSRTRGTSSRMRLHACARRGRARPARCRTPTPPARPSRPRRPAPRRCRGTAWPAPASRTWPTGCRSGSPRGTRRSWPTGCPRPRPRAPHQARRTSWASAASDGTDSSGRAASAAELVGGQLAALVEQGGAGLGDQGVGHGRRRYRGNPAGDHARRPRGRWLARVAAPLRSADARVPLRTPRRRRSSPRS